MEKTWIVLANHSVARVLAMTSAKSDIEPVLTVENPHGRSKNAQLVTAAPGRATDNRMRARHSYSNEEDPKEHAVRTFYRELIDQLDRAYSRHQFSSLILIAEPRLLGLLRSLLTKQLRRIVQNEIHQEVVHETPEQIRARLEQR